ncbi:uncharacterized protein LOC125661742 [Ostrea edulis]|uniref:uncharacterized protein LOC125661742 n=1 Tax=Ostrea edulis TaxID=37623 RepID=UPI00209543B7|nr:uncharacterized protein LOC125661742 [Ostrea edulis]
MAEKDIANLISKSSESSNHEPYWSQLEKEILHEEVISRIEIIEGKFKGSQSGKYEKENAWQAVTATVNAKGACKKRTIKQAKKQWSNMKQRAKKINSSGKYPSTGGGPKPPSPSPIDEAMLAFLSGKPSLEGVEGGMETSVSLHIGKQ